MNERADGAGIIASLHQARLQGDLPAMCAHFADIGRFEIIGSSADKPIRISADNLASFRPWLAMMVKVYRFNNYSLDQVIVDGRRIAANWRVDIHSKVTGVSVPTELIDLAEVHDGRIVSYKEFFVPR
jgi:ketosteroid isomerase-like protein